MKCHLPFAHCACACGCRLHIGVPRLRCTMCVDEDNHKVRGCSLTRKGERKQMEWIENLWKSVVVEAEVESRGSYRVSEYARGKWYAAFDNGLVQHIVSAPLSDTPHSRVQGIFYSRDAALDWCEKHDASY